MASTIADNHLTQQRVVIFGSEDQVFVKHRGESNFILITGLYECKTAEQIDQPLENLEIECIKQPVENEDQSNNFPTENEDQSINFPTENKDQSINFSTEN